MYVLHLHWHDFLTMAQQRMVEDQPLTLTLLTDEQRAHGIDVGFATCLVAGFLDRQRLVHAARLKIEFVETLAPGDDQRAAHAMQRAHQALDGVRQVVRQAGLAWQPGLLLVPGLREELQRLSTHHDLWRWEGGRDPQQRRLVLTLPDLVECR